MVRNDAGELASLKKVLLERRQQRKAEKRRAKQLARAMGVISAEATRARAPSPSPCPPPLHVAIAQHLSSSLVRR